MDHGGKMNTLYKDRIERLRTAAEAQGLKALVIWSKGSRNLSGTSTHGNLRYLMDWTTWGSPSLFLLPVQGTPVLIVPIPGDVEQAHETLPWLDDIRFGPGAEYGKMIRRLLEEKGIKGRIGTLGISEASYGIYTDLMASSPDWTMEEADVLLDEQRMVKDEVGLAGMRRAAQTCDVMLKALAQALRKPQIPAWQAKVEMEQAGWLDGAEVVWSWFVTGARPDHPRVRREENSREIQMGDCVVAGIILNYAGYFGHTLRMMTVGEPSPEHILLWNGVREAQQAAAALLKPGIDVSLPNVTAEQVLFHHFPHARIEDKIRFRPCHFIGLDYSEYPSARIKSSQTHADVVTGMALEAGMTMEVHPNIRPDELGFGAIGDIYLVTPNGGECLTTFPHEITVVYPDI
jgi:Xaa-Pro aminopeptidase